MSKNKRTISLYWENMKDDWENYNDIMGKIHKFLSQLFNQRYDCSHLIIDSEGIFCEKQGKYVKQCPYICGIWSPS